MERRKFTREFKLEAVKLIQECGGDDAVFSDLERGLGPGNIG